MSAHASCVPLQDRCRSDAGAGLAPAACWGGAGDAWRARPMPAVAAGADAAGGSAAPSTRCVSLSCVSSCRRSRVSPQSSGWVSDTLSSSSSPPPSATPALWLQALVLILLLLFAARTGLGSMLGVQDPVTLAAVSLLLHSCPLWQQNTGCLLLLGARRACIRGPRSSGLRFSRQCRKGGRQQQVQPLQLAPAQGRRK